MFLSRIKKLQPLLFVISLGVLLCTDILFYLNGDFPQSVLYLREGLIIFVILNSLPLFRKFELFQSKNIITALKGLGALVLSLYAVWLIFALTLDPFDRSGLFASLPAFLGGMGITLIFAGLLFAAMFVLRDLILFKRRRFSVRQFNLFVGALGVQVLYAVFAKSGMTIPYASEVLLFLVIILIVINSLRNSWVNNLNKKQKIRCLVMGAPLLAAAIVFFLFAASQSVMESYSVALATFIHSMGLFLSTYVGLGFLSVILHLPTASLFDRKIREIQSFQELSKSASSILDSNEILKLISEKTASVIKADILWFEILDSRTGKLNLSMTESQNDLGISESELPRNGLSSWVMQNRQSVLINDVSKDPRTTSFNGVRNKFGSLLAAPLVAQKGVIGVLYSGKRDPFAFDEEDRELLQSFANQATISLENARLFNELIEKERFEQELKIAHDAQQKLLPKDMPDMPGLEIAAMSSAANEVGGDYYDFFELDEDRLGIAVGDVSGKGAKAAFYMAELKGVIESIARIYSSPKEVMVHINETLCRNLDRQTFISLIYSVFDFKKKELVFARAGHCPLLHFASDKSECKFLEPPGLGLGLNDSDKFTQVLSEQKVKLRNGDVFVYYTDGVTEARNKMDEEFKETRLLDLVSQHSASKAHELKDFLVTEVTDFVGGAKHHDDFTFVVAKIR